VIEKMYPGLVPFHLPPLDEEPMATLDQTLEPLRPREPEREDHEAA
jgi:hypothetical protein